MKPTIVESYIPIEFIADEDTPRDTATSAASVLDADFD
jgi:hypothetical protein